MENVSPQGGTHTVWWRKKDTLTAESFSDPLARRIFVRTQPELRREEMRDAYYRGVGAGAGANGNAAAGMAGAFLLETLWVIIVSICEQIPYEWRRARDARRRAHKKSEGRLKVHYPEV
jgi:hypothetical protein